MKLGCVVQGNIRVPLKPILESLTPHFDAIVVSSWIEDKERCPAGKYELVLNERPSVAGVTNRNLQRLTTAKGLKLLRDRGCTHVLKWRTDLLPTRLNVQELLQLCGTEALSEFGGRIITGSFRHLSVVPDWFSSFPDLYSFSTLEGAEYLWSDEGFHYDRMFNMPRRMRDELNIGSAADSSSFRFRDKEYSLTGIYGYDAHTELYAIFKDRIERRLNRSVTHPEIVSRFFHLISDRQLGICWLNPSGTLPFRPIRQGYHLRWWREGSDFKPTLYDFDQLQRQAAQGRISRLFWAFPIRLDVARQYLTHLRYSRATGKKL